MLDSFSVVNFKSFAEAELQLADLTVLVGANASGKSNLIEGLQLLSWLARGRRLHDLQTSLREREVSLRGLETELTRTTGAPLRFLAKIRGVDDLGELQLALSVGRRNGQPGLCVLEETLNAPHLESTLPLYSAAPADGLSGTLKVAYNNFSRGRLKPEIPAIDQQAVFTQLTSPAHFDARHTRSIDVIPRAAQFIQKTLESVKFLDPNPSAMRGYSFRNEIDLATSGRNVSAVLYSLCQTTDGKDAVLDFVRALPEQLITNVSFVETPRNEVMVQLWESFGANQVPRDAGLLSDGTLRVLAIAAALLSARQGDLVVIEEIDNGVHPSRAQHLADMIQTTAKRRGLRVLLTTHNPALMNALRPEALESVVTCFRDESGNSRLVRLADLPRYPELIAQGRLGDIATRGVLDKFIKPGSDVQYEFGDFFEILKASEN